MLQLAGADPSILTLEIRYQRDQTYYGQAFGPTRNTLWAKAKVWTYGSYGMGISTCLHVHISTYLGTNWLQSTVTYDHCRNATMLYESTCSTFAHWRIIFVKNLAVLKDHIDVILELISAFVSATEMPLNEMFQTAVDKRLTSRH